MFSRHPTQVTSAGHARRIALPIVLVVTALLAATLTPVPSYGQDDAFGDSGKAGVHRPAVEALAWWGYLEGTECDTDRFCPRDPIERWVMAVWLVRGLGYTPYNTETSRFADVPADAWWSPYTERIARLEVTSGCRTEPLSYCPNKPVTRGQMAAFLVRALKIEAAPSAGFVDTEGTTHEAGIDALAAAGITSGCKTEPLSYCPNKPVTRAQMATFLHRAIRTSDRAILAVLYHTTGGKDWTSRKNWLTAGQLEAWRGVTTDDEDRVIELDLTANRLAGRIPSILGDLSELRTLKLAENRLTGSIPPELGSLRQLTELHLMWNLLDGPFPAELNKPVSLRWLDLEGNGLSGAIPAGIGDFANLGVLNLRSNALSGPIPAELGSVTSLTWISLGGNKLAGSIPPELGDLEKLRVLGLDDNLLTGAIPPELGRLSDLRNLNLSHNALTGEIPDQVGDLTWLRSLFLNDNMLAGEIPTSLGDLAHLFDVRLHGGNRFEGCIPEGLRDAGDDLELLQIPFC